MFEHLSPFWLHLEIFFLVTSGSLVTFLCAGWLFKWSLLETARTKIVIE